MKTQKINHLAVWLGIVLFQAMSFLWYSPTLFAGAWMGYLGKTMADFDGESMHGLLFAIVGAISICYLLAWLWRRLGIDSAAKGLAMGFVLAICCFALETFTQDSFSMRPLGLTLINSGIVVLKFSVVGLLLGGWRKYQNN